MIDRLSIKELQEMVGESNLERIANIVPNIPNSSIEHPNDIYEKEFLVKIFISFCGEDIFLKKNFRRALFSRLSDSEIRSLASMLNINSELTFNKLINKLSNLEWGHNKSTKIILDFFKLPIDYFPAYQKKQHNVELIEKAESPYKVLKDYQVRIFEKSMEKMTNPVQRFMIQMPTGSGKTRTIMETIAFQLNENPDKSIMWIATSEELCEQAVECFRDVWMHVGNFDVDVIRIWGKNNFKVPVRGSFIVCGFSKLNYAFNKDQLLAKKYGEKLFMIVVDEAHKVIAPTYKKVVNKLLSDNFKTHLVGLTATPGRSYISKSTTQDLSNFFEGERIEIDSGDDTVFDFLRDKQILANIVKDPLITELYYELSDMDKRYVEKYFDYPPGFLERISQDDARNLEIVKKMKDECSMNKNIIFFAGSIAQSKFICAILNFMGFKAEHVDGATGKDRRKNIVEKFKQGKLNVICNFGVLTTGFDAPKTDVVFIARPTMSVVLYSQMVGRGLRGPAIGGTNVCKLIDVIDNIEMYGDPGMVYDYFDDYWS